MNEDIVIPAMFFVTVIILVIGVPLVRSYIKRKELTATRGASESLPNERLERIEQSIDAVAVEVERIAEGQRFVTKLLAERPKEPAVIASTVRQDH